MAWDYSGRDFGIDISMALDTLMLDQQEQLEVIALVAGFHDVADAANDSGREGRDMPCSTAVATCAPCCAAPDRPRSSLPCAPPMLAGATALVVLKTYVYNRNRRALAYQAH